ncbi:RNA polymerase III transcription factor IIIC subunit-domain-containing protein [Crepidotus variabilis]|uniref:RNA polymerase III transcription factor IIIC subunit-domain-containing protein n=1 Tax=Crepidotus variabilis TaxID=179855 RepID=A0A9P6ESX8_9AGAR|nr:RNA polymerase III transcription factor IIIC subunit-domain-containing protein [Crepidotus variabilis]
MTTSTQTITTFSVALEKPLPQVAYYSVEYPGYVQPPSVPLAIQHLGGQAKLDHAFRRSLQKSSSLLELFFHPDNPFVHPIPGDVIAANNLVLKIIKRKRKFTGISADHSDPGGEYTAQIVGIVSKTVRFRVMADFQFHPQENDPVAKLRFAMDHKNVEALRAYRIPSRGSGSALSLATTPTDVPMDIDPEILSISDQPAQRPEGLRLFPPPLFSRQTIPQGYNYKGNPASIVTTAVDEQTGEERKRVINKMRWKGYGPASIMFTDGHVPTKPPPNVENGKNQASAAILAKLNNIFQDRPIWTRSSLFNQFSALESREILNSKLLLSLCCYVFQDGPWRDTLVRFAYDPRKEPTARIYQRIYFRNANHPISRPSVMTRRQERIGPVEWRNNDPDGGTRSCRTSHIFDGHTLSKETAAFQLCDITDSMLKEMIEDPEGLRETCHEKDGWYTSHALEQVKTVLRHKFFSLLEGHPVSDEDCRALLLASEGSAKATSSGRSSKLRPGKHNMAKGALRPEDAAALRLRATLDRNIKSFHSLRGQ